MQDDGLGLPRPPVDREARRKSNLVRTIVSSGWGATLAVMFAIIGVCMFLWLTGKTVPDGLYQWGTLAVAWIFKEFNSGTLKDYVAEDEESG